MKYLGAVSPVSVVIPAYNAEDFLEETVTSALAAHPKEIIIVDDGSTDDTFLLAERLAKKSGLIKVLKQTNRGESAALNLGLNQSESPFVLFLSADDLIFPSLLSSATQLLESRNDLSAVYPSWYEIDKNGRILSKNVDLAFSDLRLFGQLDCLPGPGSVIRREALGFGRNESLRQLGDLEQWLRIQAFGPMLHIMEPLACWRRHDKNFSLGNYGKTTFLELDVVFDTVSSQVGPGGRMESLGLWYVFLHHWYRRKAIAASRITFSLSSIRYLIISFKYASSLRNTNLKFPWTLLEILGCGFPFLVWLRDSLKNS